VELNKIYNIDCIEGMKKLNDSSIDLILTDIPYGNVTKNGEERAKYAGQLRKIDKGFADILTFDLHQFLEECQRICKGSIYIFCALEQLAEIYGFFENSKDFMVRQCAWRKTNPAPTNGQHMWLSSFENCVFAKRRKTKFYRNCKGSVWDFPVGRSKLHPTEKPLALFEYLLLSSTDEGDIVLDPCIGSGTSAVAAAKNKRNFIGFDINPVCVDIANERVREVWNENLQTF